MSIRLTRDDLDFVSHTAAATRRSGSKLAYLLSILTFLFFVAFAVWARFAIIDEVTRGLAKVVPSSRTQVVQNLEGGIVSDILVRNGDIVEAGDVLVRIDNVLAETSLRDARGKYLAFKVAIARLEAELEGRELSFPEELGDEAAPAIADQRQLYEARQRELDSQISVLESQAEQKAQEIKELQSRREQLKRNLGLAYQERSITKPLVDRGIISRIDLLRLDRQIADLDGQIKTIDISIPRAETALEEARQRTSEVRFAFRTKASEELNRVRAELRSVSEIMTAGEDRVVRTDVRSPVRGNIKDLRVNTIGGVIQPGQDIAEIVPLDDTLLIEARIRPSDIAFLAPGQKATVKITAYDFSIYGGMKAELEQISADTVEDPEGESYYRVLLRTETNEIVHNGRAHPIIPGMTATVEILTGEKSVLDYLLKPILKARHNALTER